jgi:hypothetical protein
MNPNRVGSALPVIHIKGIGTFFSTKNKFLSYSVFLNLTWTPKVALGGTHSGDFSVTAFHCPLPYQGGGFMAIKPGWQIKGIYNEACAAEGYCPYYFGRNREGGCRYFMVFRIKEGKVNDVDLAGTTIIYNGDIPHPSFEELLKQGSEGGVYISDNATPEQRKVLDLLAVENVGGVLMKKIFGVKYVKMEIDEDGKTAHFKMPCGEMKQELSKGLDGKPVRLENQTLPFLSNVKACHSHFWNYKDFGRHFDYKDRCGTWADFTFTG